ncbi:hypothetical protein KJA13_04165 [Patescibacteria group bacterium]|nr:hypothetical protein [Patescibacteria group bacterium]
MNRGVENSILLRQLRDLKEAYLTMEAKISSVYLESLTHRLIKKMNERIKVCFRYSFWGRISEIKEIDSVLLDDSRALRYLINFYKRWRDRIIRYSKASSTVNVAEDTRKQLIFSPVKIISIIVITAVLVNAVLSVILQKQMGLWGFFIRVLFLSAGAAGLSCPAGWPTVKKSSVFLRKMRMD